jgi:GT2 family glycosyltransferase/glycosyltransferase involved in cell wall biosynthesis
MYNYVNRLASRRDGLTARNEGKEALDYKAITLVNRLVEVDGRIHDLLREQRLMQEQLRGTASQGTDQTSSFDVPKTTHAWPLAQIESLTSKDLGLYDVRVDDSVVVEGRRGDDFMQRFNLQEGEPNFYAAVDALNAISPNSQANIEPDVSIIVPIYGQLAYTLNAIDSLLRHKSRYTAEVIIVDDRSPDESAIYLPLVKSIRYHKQPKNGGFIASCNAGGELARGSFIVMLNNDTRVVDGWLNALIDSFTCWPAAGLVGSKMHYADGSLQEAGGIIWRDGTAWNYGRGDDPNRPQYSYARQVDYISGCSIALRTTLWRELRGFDIYFHPAYCEDVDLAFRVRAAGYEVWFQPQSRIVHYEGKTSGTDTGSGTKAYQVINTKKIYLRWHEQISRHRPNGQAPYFERERGVHKRFLVVDVTAPTPDRDAGSVQTFMALQVCMALGYKTSFVPQDNWLFQPKYTTALQGMGVDCAYAPYELGFEAYMQRYGWQFDAIMVYRPTVMEKCLPLIRAYSPQAVVLFHVADLHYLRMERTAALDDNDNIRAAAALMKERELSIISQVDCTITHSHVERDILSLEAPDCPVALWPLMFEHFGTKVTFAARRDICFLGGYRHPPNVDAVIYFVNEIFPLLRTAEPGIRFIVAGSYPPEEILNLACEDIIVTGMVEDLRDLFDPCRVFVCPLRVGAGVKGKVASALSYGIPIVSTTIGVEGTELEHQDHLLVADNAEDFAAEVLRLYRKEALWNQLSVNGQKFVEEKLSLEMGRQVLTSALESAIAHKLGVPLSQPPHQNLGSRP